MGSDGTISDEENFENDSVESDFDDASTSSDEDEYGYNHGYRSSDEDVLLVGDMFSEGYNLYREVDSDSFLKEPSSGIGLFFPGLY